MKQIYQTLCTGMMTDIEKCMQGEDAEKIKVEDCFWIACMYWDKLKELIRRQPFTIETDEIDFFKTIKPKFTCNIEYFVILSETLLFVPEDNKLAISYWKDEMKRYDRFRDKHIDFIQYYESGSSQLDPIYFTRVKKGQMIKMVTYDNDPVFCSSHDWKIRKLLAQKKYHEYANSRLQILCSPHNETN